MAPCCAVRPDTYTATDTDTDTDTDTETDIISYLFVPVYGSVTPYVGSRDSPLETGDKCILTVDSYDQERLNVHNGREA